MNSLIIIINLLVLIIFLGGWVFLLIIAWRSMKAIDSIVTILNKNPKMLQDKHIVAKNT